MVVVELSGVVVVVAVDSVEVELAVVEVIVTVGVTGVHGSASIRSLAT